MDTIFAERRLRLSQSLPEEAGAVFFSGEEIPLGVDMVYPFSVDRNFYYLTGLDMPGAALWISREQTILFLPPFDPKRELYEGPQETREELCARAGVPATDCCDTAAPEDLWSLLPKTRRLFLDLKRPEGGGLKTPAARLACCAREKGVEPENVYRTVYALRAVKDGGEIAAIRRAIDLTGEGLAHMVRSCRAGMREYEWRAAFEAFLSGRGCSTSFPSIAACGANAVFLHYTRANSTVRTGELFLFDVGAYCDHYAADISRTYPVGAPFTPRQREVYQLVYDATRLVLEKMQPYRPYRDHVEALQAFFARYIRPLHIVDTPLEEERFLHMLSRGCCHHLGLDAHDAYAELDDLLLPGMVFTNEPGVYLRREGIGDRIEEDLLITETGNELLSRNIPASPDAVLDLLS